MNSKLEERLYLYERDHPIHSDQDLLTALEAILEEQDSFPVEQRDFDLISEATEFVLNLQGYSDEELTEMANASGKRILDRIHERSIPAKRRTPKSRRTRLAWIILVAIVGALTITSVSASIKGVNILTATKNSILSLIEKDALSTDSSSYKASNNTYNYDSIEDLLNDYGELGILIPFNTEKIEFTKIASIVYNDEVSITILMFLPSLDATASITHSDLIQDPIATNDTVNGFDVLVSQHQNNFQYEFLDDYNNHYVIQSNSTTAIKTILISMEAPHE